MPESTVAPVSGAMRGGATHPRVQRLRTHAAGSPPQPRSFQSRCRGSVVQHVKDTIFHLHQDKEGTTCKTVQYANPVSRQNQARDSQREGKMNHRSASALSRGQGTGLYEGSKAEC